MIARILGCLLLPVKWLVVGFFRVLGWLYMVVLAAFSLSCISLPILILLILLGIIFKQFPPPLYH